MKQIILLFFIFAFAVISFAQPPSSSNDRKLQMDLKRLERKIETLKKSQVLPSSKNNDARKQRAIENAEAELANFKQSHPDYDVSTFENEISNAKNGTVSPGIATNSSPGKSVADYQKIDEAVATIDEILKFSLNISELVRDEENALDNTKKQIKEFREKMSKTLTPEFIELANKTDELKIKRAKEKAVRSAESMQTELSRVKVQRIKDETRIGLMLAKYSKVLIFNERLNQLQKIYGDSSEIKTAEEAVGKLVAELGTFDDIEAQGKENYAKLVAERRMLPAQQNNPALEKQFISAFRSNNFQQGKDGIANALILKVHILSRSWSITRNELTGIILSRDQFAQFAVKASDGKCYSYQMVMEQKHLGGGKYGRGYASSGTKLEMLCENVPK